MQQPTIGATKTVTGGHTDGTAAFNITFTDLAGNNGAAVNSLTGGDDAVRIDKTIPTITTASIASNNAVEMSSLFQEILSP